MQREDNLKNTRVAVQKSAPAHCCVPLYCETSDLSMVEMTGKYSRLEAVYSKETCTVHKKKTNANTIRQIQKTFYDRLVKAAQFI
jgi:hypothetical protein